jgi:hypothetical protein
VLSVDVMFIQKIAVLVGVSTPLDLTLATSLSSFDKEKPRSRRLLLQTSA